MKKIISLLGAMFLALVINAQLDTMLIRTSVTLQAKDWAWLRGKVGAARDSAILKSDRNVNLQLRATQNLTWTTSVSIDSLPGKLVFAFYQVLRKDAGEMVDRYSAILSALQGVTRLTTYYTNYEMAILNDANSAITIGKYIYLDQ